MQCGIVLFLKYLDLSNAFKDWNYHEPSRLASGIGLDFQAEHLWTYDYFFLFEKCMCSERGIKTMKENIIRKVHLLHASILSWRGNQTRSFCVSTAKPRLSYNAWGLQSCNPIFVTSYFYNNIWKELLFYLSIFLYRKYT